VRTVPAGRPDVASCGADEANLNRRHLLYRCVDLGMLRLEADNITARQRTIVRAVRIAREAQLDPFEVADDADPLNAGLGALLGQVGVQSHPEHDEAAAEQDDPDDKAGDPKICHDLGLHRRLIHCAAPWPAGLPRERLTPT
jgi:hypothetical protein